jgi:hypothetical protein
MTRRKSYDAPQELGQQPDGQNVGPGDRLVPLAGQGGAPGILHVVLERRGRAELQDLNLTGLITGVNRLDPLEHAPVMVADQSEHLIFVTGEFRVTSFACPEQNAQGHAHDPSRPKRARVLITPACTSRQDAATTIKRRAKPVHEVQEVQDGTRGDSPVLRSAGRSGQDVLGTVAPRGWPRDGKAQA